MHKEQFSINTAVERSEEGFREFHAVVTNIADQAEILDAVTLFETCDLASLGIGEGPYDVFRSGRHKNDMPGVFTIGVNDERLKDVASAMAESGDGQEAGDACRVVSDHLTIIKGASGKCFVIEFLTGRDQLFETVIDLDEQGNFASLRARVLFHTEFAPGESAKTESIRLAVLDEEKIPEEIAEFAERKAALYGRRNGRRPAVFCTWYYYGLSVTYEDVRTNLSVIKERKLPYDVFQVDEGWEITLGEYEPNYKFPLPMKAVADEIREAGLIPGIWSSPFVAHEIASVWKAHPEWILKDKAGRPCLFPMNDTVYYVFDITNPATYDYFRELYRKFTFDWGYTYHKLDFTRAAVIYEDAAFFDRHVTLAQAYYRAVRAIREGMGEEAFFLMCGGLYDPIIGLVDAQRTGSDVLSMWSSTVNKGGKTAPYTIRQSLMRSYMNRWWANDPDALMIRKNETMELDSRLTLGLLNDEEVKTSVVNQFAGGGIMCQTEPLDRVTDDRLMEIRHILPVLETEVRPLDFLSGERFPGAVDVYVKKTGAHCVCLVNWSDDEEMKISMNLAEVLKGDADPEASYTAASFYSGEYRTGLQADGVVEFAPIAPHAAAVIKIEKMKGQPIVVKSDGHYAMGAELEALTVQDGKLVFEKKSILPALAHYTVLLPESGETLEMTLEPGEESAELEPVQKISG